MKRGNNPQAELAHAELLLNSGAEGIWGWDSVAGRERVKRRVQWLTQACGLKRGVTVLECGCGTGIFTRHLALTGADITAVDISPLLLETARAGCAAENVRFLEADLEKPDLLEEGYFDVMLGVSVLHHLNMPNALKALRIKLKPGALFAFSEPNIRNPINRYYLFTKDLEKRLHRGVSPSEMAFLAEELKGHFEVSGFKVDGLELRDFLHPSTPERLIPLVTQLEVILERIPLIRSYSGSLWIKGHKL